MKPDKIGRPAEHRRDFIPFANAVERNVAVPNRRYPSELLAPFAPRNQKSR